MQYPLREEIFLPKNRYKALNLAYITLGATETPIILRIKSNCMPQFPKLTLYNQINLSVGFQDYFSHLWEYSRFIIQTVIKQTQLHIKALLDKTK